MTKETHTEKPPTPSTTTIPVSVDLSDIIEKTIQKEPNEEIKSVRVFGDHYRCNWWVRDRPAHWLSSTTGKISKSRLLKVTKTQDGGLRIEGMEASG